MRIRKQNTGLLPDHELMGLIVTGDVAAFEVLYDRYKDRMFYFFLRMLGNCEETANDFLQDLCIKIIDKPHLYQPDYSFATWIFSVANNMCKNEFRKRKTRNYIPVEYVENKIVHDDQSKQKENSEKKLNAILREIDNLNDEMKMVLILKYKENFGVKEIAEVMDLPEGTVKSRLFYARKELSKRLSYLNG